MRGNRKGFFGEEKKRSGNVFGTKVVTLYSDSLNGNWSKGTPAPLGVEDPRPKDSWTLHLYQTPEKSFTASTEDEWNFSSTLPKQTKTELNCFLNVSHSKAVALSLPMESIPEEEMPEAVVDQALPEEQLEEERRMQPAPRHTPQVPALHASVGHLK